MDPVSAIPDLIRDRDNGQRRNEPGTTGERGVPTMGSGRPRKRSAGMLGRDHRLRNCFLSILPTVVSGSASRNSISLGTS